MHFNRITTEANCDFVRIKIGSGQVQRTVSGNVIPNGTINAFGRTDDRAIVHWSTITVELTTDYSVAAWVLRTDVASWFQ